jgi:hypothetical protein
MFLQTEDNMYFRWTSTTRGLVPMSRLSCYISGNEKARVVSAPRSAYYELSLVDPPPSDAEVIDAMLFKSFPMVGDRYVSFFPSNV